MSASLIAIITTIQEPTPSVRGLIEAIDRVDGALLVIGDKKGQLDLTFPAQSFSPYKTNCDCRSDLYRSFPWATMPERTSAI